MGKEHFRTSLLGATSALALCCVAAPAFAGAFALREQGAAGQGMSYAGVASGSGGLSSMYWNPATITMNPGWQSYNSVSLIDLDAKITRQPGTSPLLGNLPSGELGQTAAVPASYVSYQISDQWWVGLSSGAPFGLVTKPNYNWSGQLYSRTSRIYSATFNPILGYKVNDWLSLAVGPTIEYFSVKLQRATSFVTNAPSATLRGDDVGFGMTAGATITPVAGTTIGIGYRSSINHGLQGTIVTPTAVTPIKSSLNTPDTVTVGLTQAITQDFRLNLGYEFSNWSRLRTVGQVAVAGPAAGLTISTLPLNYRDGHSVSVGGEYDLNAYWTVRAGAGYEWSPITVVNRNTALPDANRIFASGGASYRWSNKITIDVAYTHVFADKARINITPGNANLVSAAIPGVGAVPLSFVGEAKGNANVVSAALRYRWDDPQVAQAAPIIRKY